MRLEVVLLCLAAACGGDEAVPVFPADYASSYLEVRDCRTSADHDLGRVRVLADPAALEPYADRDAAFPPGAVVLKEEYEFDDTTCTGAIAGWTAMAWLGDDAPDSQLGWRWQRVDRDRAVVVENDERCSSCHAGCGIAPDGYLGTCAVP